MYFEGNIILPRIICLLILGGCFFAVLKGRVELVLGAYLALISSARTIMFGPIALFWVLAATIAFATVSIYALRARSSSFYSFHDRWIFLWMGHWFFWTAVLISFLDPGIAKACFRNLLMWIILPLPAILLFAGELTRVKVFAWSFVITSVLNSALIIDIPALLQGAFRFFDVYNYHRIGVGLGIATIFAFALLHQARKISARMLITGVFLFLAMALYANGSRLNMIAASASLVILFLWALTCSTEFKKYIMVLLGIGVAMAMWLYAQAPYLLVRALPDQIEEKFIGDVNLRFRVWHQGLEKFYESPVWGFAFSWDGAHNLFIGIMVDEGLVGMIFFGGLLIFVGRQCRLLWRRRSPEDQALWEMVFQCMFLYGMVRGQFSGNALSIWEMYWSAAFLWCFASRPRIQDEKPRNELTILRPVRVY